MISEMLTQSTSVLTQLHTHTHTHTLTPLAENGPNINLTEAESPKNG